MEDCYELLNLEPDNSRGSIKDELRKLNTTYQDRANADDATL